MIDFMTYVTPPCSGKVSIFNGLRLLLTVGSARNRPFRWRSHRDTLAPLGLGLLIVSALLYIMAARTFHHDGWRCHPSDHATTNGRELCPDRGAPR